MSRNERRLRKKPLASEPSESSLPLILVLALAGVPLGGVDGTADLLVVLMVRVTPGDIRYLVDPLSACSGCSSA